MTRDPQARWLDACRRTDLAARAVARAAIACHGIPDHIAEAYRNAVAAEQVARRAWLDVP